MLTKSGLDLECILVCLSVIYGHILCVNCFVFLVHGFSVVYFFVVSTVQFTVFPETLLCDNSY